MVPDKDDVWAASVASWSFHRLFQGINREVTTYFLLLRRKILKITSFFVQKLHHTLRCEPTSFI
jgi:hypothetical protein